ncbi:MAG: dihydrofolate reductase family protein [Actinomycetes bacterium]
MRKTVAHLFSTVDGAVDDPSRFQFDSFDAGVAAAMERHLSTVDAMLLGRVLYEEWADYWPGHDDPDDFGAFINPLRKYVVSSTLQEPLAWQNSTLLHGDPMDAVRALKHAEGRDIAVGGITMIRSLLDHNLLDELILTVHPALAGIGRRLMYNHEHVVRLVLVAHEATEKGNLVLTYRKRPRH